MRSLNSFEEVEQERLERKLHRAGGLHAITPRCCATCEYYINVEATGNCLRDGGFSGEPLEAYFHVCNGYRQEEQNK